MPLVEGESLRDRLRRNGPQPVADVAPLDRASWPTRWPTPTGTGSSTATSSPRTCCSSGQHVAARRLRRRPRARDQRRRPPHRDRPRPRHPGLHEPGAGAGRRRPSTARTDLYSLGCVLYELLTGEPPYTGPTAQAIVAKRLSDPVPSARRLRETVPPAVDDILQRLLAKSPADRFASAAELGGGARGAAGDHGRRARQRSPAPAPPFPPHAYRRTAPSPPSAPSRGSRASSSPARPDSSAFAAAAARHPAPPARSERRRRPPVPRHRARPRPRLPRRGPRGSARRQARRLGRDPRRPAAPAPRGAGRPARDGAVRRRGRRGRAPGGAGMVLDGSLVRSAAGVELSATLRRSMAAGRPVRGSAAGSLDSLPVLVDRLAAQLLAGRAGELTDARRALHRPAPSPSTCRARRPLRQGRYGEAKARLSARAARRLDLRARRGRAARRGEPPTGPGGGRARRATGLGLSRQAQLRSAGCCSRRGSGPSIPRRRARSRRSRPGRRRSAAEPDLPEAWFELGDRQLHDGRTNDLPHPVEQARTSFRRALELAPSWVLPLDHLILAQLDLDDTVGLRALARPLAGAGHRPGRPLALRALAPGHRPGRFRRGRAHRRGARPLGRRRAALAGGPGPGRGRWVWPTSSARSARSSAVRWPGPSYGTRGFAGETGCSIPAAPPRRRR